MAVEMINVDGQSIVGLPHPRRRGRYPDALAFVTMVDGHLFLPISYLQDARNAGFEICHLLLEH